MIKYLVQGSFCVSCMGKFVEKAKSIPGIEDIDFNSISKSLKLELGENSNSVSITETLNELLSSIEPDAYLEIETDGNKREKIRKLGITNFVQINKDELIRIAISILLILIATFSFNNISQRILYALAMIILGKEVFLNSINGIKNGNMLDENFLMSLAGISAFLIGEEIEGFMVLALYTAGEMLENLTSDNTRASIKELMDLKVDTANLVINGEVKTVNTEDVGIGEEIVILPGEKIPLDSKIISGKTQIDTSSLTGEPMPVSCSVNDEIMAGYINKDGLIHAIVQKTYENSSVYKILEMVEESAEKKSNSEKFITKFSRYYTPIVCILAALIAFVPPIFGIGTYRDFIYRALAFLVVSCPCALVISVPLGYFAGIGAASSRGILIKGNNYIEAVQNLKAIAFDKTGTITKGEFKISDVVIVSDYDENNLIEILSKAESPSTHPIAKAIVNSYYGQIMTKEISKFEEIAGIGISAEINGKKIIAGNSDIFEKFKIDNKNKIDSSGKTAVYLVADEDYKGYVLLEDRIKENSKEAIAKLNSKSIETVLLTGDKEFVAKDVAARVGIKNCCSQLLPNEKVEEIEEIIDRTDGSVAFVGDGINDAPVLRRADVGFAMGSLGSDAAIEAADIVIMGDDLTKVAESKEISDYTGKIVRQNVIFSIGIKLIIMGLSAFGIASLAMAVFGDTGVSLLAILNTRRISRKFKN